MSDVSAMLEYFSIFFIENSPLHSPVLLAKQVLPVVDEDEIREVSGCAVDVYVFIHNTK